MLEACEDRTVPTPVVTIAALADAYEGGTSGTFRLTRTDTTGSFSVTLAYSGTATPNTDYLPGVAMFMPGSATADVSIMVDNDSVSEPTEGVIATIQAGTGYTIGYPDFAAISIWDDDPQVVSVDAEDAGEHDDPGVFRFKRIGDLIASLTVNFTVGGTATSGTDYTSIGTSVTFLAGETYADKVITVLPDNLVEGTETVIATVTSGTGYSIGSPDEATVNIADDAPVSEVNRVVSVYAWDGVFGQQLGTFRLLRGDVNSPPVVSYYLNISDDPNSETPTSSYRMVTFEPGRDMAEVTVSPSELGDTSKAWYVSLDVMPSAGIETDLSSSSNLVVWPYVSPSAFTIEDVTAAVAGGSAGQVLISRQNASSALNINYSVDPSSTAVAGADHAALSGVLSFAPGQTQAAIVVDASAFPNAGGKDVVLNLASPLAGFRFNAQPLVPIRQQQPNPPPNRNPFFTDAAGQAVNQYDVPVGIGTKKGVPLYQVHAADPDGDQPIFRVFPFSTSLFRVDAAGVIWAAQDIPFNQGPVTVTLVVMDGRGGVGLVSVNVVFKPLVLISGDLAGVRQQIVPNQVDNIRLDFVRPTVDLPTAPDLWVEFTIDWGGVSIAGPNPEVTNEGTIPRMPNGNYRVFIPAGRARGWIDIHVSHAALPAGQRAETFVVSIVDHSPHIPGGVNEPNPALQYVSNQIIDPDWQQGASDLDSIAFVGQSRAQAYVIPAVRLFAGMSNDVRFDSLLQPLSDGGNSRVNINDIWQGAIGDCGPLAMLGQLAHVAPQRLIGSIVPQPNGQIRFTFSKDWTQPAQIQTVDVDPFLTGGVNYAQMSWDYDTDAQGTNAYEIWVQLFERAYDTFRRGSVEHRGVGSGGNSSISLYDFTGVRCDPAINLRTTAIPAVVLQAMIVQAIQQNRPVYLVTSPQGDRPNRTFPDSREEVVYNHAYAIVGLRQEQRGGQQVTCALVFNPHGKLYSIPLDQLFSYFDWLEIGTGAV